MLGKYVVGQCPKSLSGTALVKASQMSPFLVGSSARHLRKRVVYPPTPCQSCRNYFGFVRVKQGQKLGLWGHDGSLEIKDGPFRTFVFGQEITFLNLHIANAQQYIRVEYLNGKKEHIQGPYTLFEHPLQHKFVTVVDAMQFLPNSGLVVWRKDESGKQEVIRVYGPTYFVPQPDDTHKLIHLHQATKNQYVRVLHLDGRLEHLRGPVSLWQDPSLHTSVKVENCISVQPGSSVVVFSEKNATGKSGKIIEGPATFVPAPFDTVSQLQAYTASDLEYLKISYIDGRVEHRPGPVSVTLDPETMNSISREYTLNIQTHECVVLYSLKNNSNPSAVAAAAAGAVPSKDAISEGSVEKRVVYGPKVLIPQPNEWLHTFIWHGSDHNVRKDGSISGKKIPGGLKFSKLRLIPDQFYFDVENVRTSDDALLAMKFMVYFELTDVQKMLDKTHDPIAELINALTSDAIEFTNSRTFEQFKADTELLGKLETYKQTCERAMRAGFIVSKVVYRGYHSSDKLQLMHDQAIEARTQLKLDSETEHQALELEDLRIKRKQERELVIQQIEVENMKHEVWKSQQKIEQDIKEKVSVHEANLRITKESNSEQITFLKNLEKMGVDLTKYLTSQYQHPDRIFRIENAQVEGGSKEKKGYVPVGSGVGTQLHLKVD